MAYRPTSQTIPPSLVLGSFSPYLYSGTLISHLFRVKDFANSNSRFSWLLLPESPSLTMITWFTRRFRRYSPINSLGVMSSLFDCIHLKPLDLMFHDQLSRHRCMGNIMNFLAPLSKWFWTCCLDMYIMLCFSLGRIYTWYLCIITFSFPLICLIWGSHFPFHWSV